jgi:OmcA/MtrC family decaheme c-type cytochrome
VSLVTVKLMVAGTDYTLDPTTGTVSELSNTNFKIGSPVLVSYTGDWQQPSIYPPALNDTPDLNDSVGKWAGKAVVDGTYTVGVWGAYAWSYARNGETNAYRIGGQAGDQNFLVGGASGVTPYPFITSPTNCMNCHDDVYAHGGGRKNFQTCVLCHGTAGSEDRPNYVAANAPGAPGVLINFRSMLHKIHMGSSLTFGDSYAVIGFGSTAYPNNFSVNTYGDIEFPVTPNGVRACDKCHGLPDKSLPAQVWDIPSDRSHPTQQVNPMARYGVACLSCHDSNDAGAHYQLMSSASGQESCLTCHGQPGATYFTGVVHLNQDQPKH